MLHWKRQIYGLRGYIEKSSKKLGNSVPVVNAEHIKHGYTVIKIASERESLLWSRDGGIYTLRFGLK